MKHKIKVRVPVEKRGLFGLKKTVYEMRIIEVDEKAYKEMQKQKRNRTFNIEEMMLYDEWDD